MQQLKRKTTRAGNGRATTRVAGTSLQQRAKNLAAIKFLQSLMTDVSGWQERNWPIAKKAIERNRTVYRKRFRD